MQGECNIYPPFNNVFLIRCNYDLQVKVTLQVSYDVLWYLLFIDVCITPASEYELIFVCMSGQERLVKNNSLATL